MWPKLLGEFGAIEMHRESLSWVWLLSPRALLPTRPLIPMLLSLRQRFWHCARASPLVRAVELISRAARALDILGLALVSDSALQSSGRAMPGDRSTLDPRGMFP